MNGQTIAVTGASGLIGRALCHGLQQSGHRPVALSRVQTPTADSPGWSPARGVMALPDDARADAVFYLAGESVAARWTASKKAAIRDSRVGPTRSLAQFLAQLDSPPRALICASAIGIYGDRGNDVSTEESMSGTGFLAGIGTAWEDAAAPARDAGIRVLHARLGIVLPPQGGALAAMLPLFRMGAGGRLGRGTQWMSWISLEDATNALLHMLQHEALRGPVNVVAPDPVTNRQFTAALARALRRPAVFRVPPFALRLMMGEAADEMLLFSTRVVPQRLSQSGFVWKHPSLEAALQDQLKKTSQP